jgi:hypothetical protein
VLRQRRGEAEPEGQGGANLLSLFGQPLGVEKQLRQHLRRLGSRVACHSLGAVMRECWIRVTVIRVTVIREWWVTVPLYRQILIVLLHKSLGSVPRPSHLVPFLRSQIKQADMVRVVCIQVGQKSEDERLGFRIRTDWGVETESRVPGDRDEFLGFFADIEPDVFPGFGLDEIKALAVLYPIHVVTHVLHKPAAHHWPSMARGRAVLFATRRHRDCALASMLFAAKMIQHGNSRNHLIGNGVFARV